MQERDIIVIGGSAGSFEPLKTIVSGLPASFPGSVLIAVHMMADSPSLLDEHLAAVGRLPVTRAIDSEPIRRGRIYVARPDYHLTVEPGRMRVLRGPRENRHRPAIDPLFRTAARVYGQRVIGILLSGQNNDGSAGLYAVKQRDGIAIVQDPAEAASSEMPRRALGYATPHYVLRSPDIAPNLVNLVQVDPDEIVMPKKKTSKKNNGRLASGEPEQNLKTAYFDEAEGNPSVFACPECHGVLWELRDGDLVHFRCRVGHSYETESLSKELSQSAEAALWAAMRALEERAAMQRRMADSTPSGGNGANRFRDQAVADDTNARIIRDIIFQQNAELEAGELDSKKTA